MLSEKTADLAEQVRRKNPLVWHITNLVTVNDCAEITVCAGGSPVMSASPEEAADMASLADVLVLNTGTVNREQLNLMLSAGLAAVKKGIPVILDPAGAGSSLFRTEAAKRLIDEVHPAVIKANAGETGILAGLRGDVRGVDSMGLEGSPEEAAMKLSVLSGAVTVVTGKSDFISNGKETVRVDNGVPLMGHVSGTGCMASAVCGAFAAVCDDVFVSAAAAMIMLGIAGELAAEKSAGPGSFKQAFMDSVYNISRQQILERCRAEKIK